MIKEQLRKRLLLFQTEKNAVILSEVRSTQLKEPICKVIIPCMSFDALRSLRMTTLFEHSIQEVSICKPCYYPNLIPLPPPPRQT